MKIYRTTFFLVVLFSASAFGQTTAFNFQGRLNDGTNPSNGSYDLQFKLFDAIVGGTQIGSTLDRPNHLVINGVFSTALDFGTAAFMSGDRFIEISIRPSGNPNPHVILGARQQILSVPLAVRATTASTAENAVRLDGVPAASFPRVDSNGYLGIGSTNPFTRLAIGDGDLWTNAGWKSSLALNNASAIGWQANASGQQFGIGQSGGGLYFFRTLSPFGNVSNPANYDLVISDAGSVGIGGAPDPSWKLDVRGLGRFQTINGNFNLGTPNGETGMTILPLSGNRADVRFNGSTLTLAAGTGTTVPANTGIAVNIGGNVGIGTLTPASKLDVRGHLTLEAGANPAIYTSAATGEQNRFLNLLNSFASPSASGLKAGGALISDDFAFANPGKNDLVVKGRTTLSSDPSFVSNFNVKLTVISSNPAGNSIYALGASASGATDVGSTIVGTGGNSGTGRGGNGASFLGGNSAGGGGNGVVATGGTGNTSPNSGAGVLSFGGQGKSGVITYGGDGSGGGILATGGISNSGEGGVGGLFKGGDSTSGRGGFGIVVNPGSGSTGSNSAAVFNGNVSVNGTLSKFGGSFKIDHPLDPTNKYLYHSFVESPDMMNVYNGNITTDEHGEAIVRLPDYFEVLNRDYRYQLTVIGQFAQAIVAEEIKHNQFKIKTDKRDVKVSWQVTGIRQDAYANAHRIPVEEEKPREDRGSYLYPQGFGAPMKKNVESTPSSDLIRLPGTTSPQTKIQPK